MEIIYRLGEATARDIQQNMPDPPSYTSVRSHLRAMCDKGYLTYYQDGLRYMYKPVVSPSSARSTALRNVLENFFKGSRIDLVATLIDDQQAGISKAELNKINELIRKARSDEK